MSMIYLTLFALAALSTTSAGLYLFTYVMGAWQIIMGWETLPSGPSQSWQRRLSRSSTAKRNAGLTWRIQWLERRRAKRGWNGCVQRLSLLSAGRWLVTWRRFWETAWKRWLREDTYSWCGREDYQIKKTARGVRLPKYFQVKDCDTDTATKRNWYCHVLGNWKV